MSRWIATAVCVGLLGVPLPGRAQDWSGMLVPSQPVVVYDAPPTGLYGQPDPLAVVGTHAGTTMLFKLNMDASGKGYTLGSGAPAANGEVAVLDWQDVSQGGVAQRWLKIDLGPDFGGASGWVLCGESKAVSFPDKSDHPCSNFDVKQ